MSSPTPEQIERLPAWVRRHIASLAGRAVRAEQALDEFRDNKSPSSTWVTDNTLELGDRYYLPSDRITFEVDKGTELQVHIEDGRLVITGVGINCFLDIRPKVSNSISVGSIER